MGRNQHHKSTGRQRRQPFCPFRKSCFFLNGESPEKILAERNFLRERVDFLESTMDFSTGEILKLRARVEELEQDKMKLENDVSDALQAPFRKYEKKEATENPKKRGAPAGHPGWYRKKPEHIDKTVDVYLESCPDCGSVRISPCNHTTEHVQEDIEEGKRTATCFIHYYYWCPECKKIVHGWGEGEMPNAFIGPDAKAKAAFLRYEIKVSYDDVQRVLEHLCDLNVTPGAIVGFDNKLYKKGEPLYEGIKETLPGMKYIHADETGWKRDWLWLFINDRVAFFHIDESRGSKVVIDHLGEFFNGVLITDFWNAYRNKIGAFAKQKCCTHLLRDIKKLLDKGIPEDIDTENFLGNLKKLIKDAIFLHEQCPILTTDAWRSARKKIMKRFKKLCRHTPLEHHKADNIRKRIITHKHELFVFLKYPEYVVATNNPAESGLRNSVIFRKLTFGNRTAQGKKNVALIMTIIRTAKLKLLDPIMVLKKILTEGITSKLRKMFGVTAEIPP